MALEISFVIWLAFVGGLVAGLTLDPTKVFLWSFTAVVVIGGVAMFA